MRKEEILKFRKKAEDFLKTARFNLKNKMYYLALFNLEQASQFLIKAKLLEKIGIYPKTHDLVFLLTQLSKTFKKREMKKFIKKNKINLIKLTDFYVTSRYYIREFQEEEVKRMFKLVREIDELLWK